MLYISRPSRPVQLAANCGYSPQDATKPWRSMMTPLHWTDTHRRSEAHEAIFVTGPSSGLKMKTVCFSETLVSPYESTRRHNSERQHRQMHASISLNIRMREKVLIKDKGFRVGAAHLLCSIQYLHKAHWFKSILSVKHQKLCPTSCYRPAMYLKTDVIPPEPCTVPKRARCHEAGHSPPSSSRSRIRWAALERGSGAHES
jgi:hypothetical protein